MSILKRSWWSNTPIPITPQRKLTIIWPSKVLTNELLWPVELKPEKTNEFGTTSRYHRKSWLFIADMCQDNSALYPETVYAKLHQKQRKPQSQALQFQAPVHGPTDPPYTYCGTVWRFWCWCAANLLISSSPTDPPMQFNRHLPGQRIRDLIDPCQNLLVTGPGHYEINTVMVISKLPWLMRLALTATCSWFGTV